MELFFLRNVHLRNSIEVGILTLSDTEQLASEECRLSVRNGVFMRARPWVGKLEVPGSILIGSVA